MEKNNKRKGIEFMGFIPPDHRDIEALKEYKECGFTICPMTEDYVKANDPEYLKSLKRMEEIGLDACVTFYRGQTPKYIEKFKDVDFRDYPAVKMIYGIDEPDDDMMNGVANVYVPWFNEKYSDSNITWFINTYGGNTSAEKYIKHVDECLERINNRIEAKEKIFSIDYYPLRHDEHWKKYLSGKHWLKGLAISSQKAFATGNRFGACIQTFDGWSNVRFPDDKNDVVFQFYANLAFGASMFDFFIYKSTEAMDYMFRGMVKLNGQKRQLYYDVQSLIKEVKTFDEEFMTFKWVGTSLIEGAEWNGEKNPDFEYVRESLDYSDDNIAKVECERDVLIGCFNKEDGSKAYVVVNYNEPSEEKTNAVTITFKKGTKIRTYIHGEEKITTLKDGKFNITMDRGDGFFGVIDGE